MKFKRVIEKEHKFPTPWSGKMTGTHDMGIHIFNAYSAVLSINKWTRNITFYDEKGEAINNIRFDSKKKAKGAFKALKRGETGHLDFREDWQQ